MCVCVSLQVFLLAHCEDNALYVRTLATGKELHTLKGHKSRVSCKPDEQLGQFQLRNSGKSFDRYAPCPLARTVNAVWSAARILVP